MEERHQRQRHRQRMESQIPPEKTLAAFDFNAVPIISKAHVSALADGDVWIDKGQNLLVFGPPSAGKSHLVCAIDHALLDRGWRVLFTRTSELVQKLQAARRDLRLATESPNSIASIC